jgi:hypothetical protein
MSPWLLALIITGPVAFLTGFLIRPLFQKETNMSVYTEVAQALTDLNAAVQALPDKVKAALAAGDPAATQDKADTVAAVQAGVASAVAAINAIGQ